jgi:hypothetical protein
MATEFDRGEGKILFDDLIEDVVSYILDNFANRATKFSLSLTSKSNYARYCDEAMKGTGFVDRCVIDGESHLLFWAEDNRFPYGESALFNAAKFCQMDIYFHLRKAYDDGIIKPKDDRFAFTLYSVAAENNHVRFFEDVQMEEYFREEFFWSEAIPVAADHSHFALLDFFRERYLLYGTCGFGDPAWSITVSGIKMNSTQLLAYAREHFPVQFDKGFLLRYSELNLDRPELLDWFSKIVA